MIQVAVRSGQPVNGHSMDMMAPYDPHNTTNLWKGWCRCGWNTVMYDRQSLVALYWGHVNDIPVSLQYALTGGQVR